MQYPSRCNSRIFRPLFLLPLSLPTLSTPCIFLFNFFFHSSTAVSACSRADRLQVDEPVTTVPTIGFNVETVQYKNIKFQVWDLGGQVRAERPPPSSSRSSASPFLPSRRCSLSCLCVVIRMPLLRWCHPLFCFPCDSVSICRCLYSLGVLGCCLTTISVHTTIAPLVWRAVLHSAVLAVLLPEHARHCLRCRLC